MSPLSVESFRNTSISYPFWFVVPAAGVGKRFGADVPKQYLSLANKTVIEHTLQKLLDFEYCKAVVVAISEEDRFWSELDVASHPKVRRVAGGAERSLSVLSALESLEGLADEDDWILVHDAARPCVDQVHIAKMLKELEGHKVGGLLAVPVSDTIKRVTGIGEVESTVDRAELWQAQTPQMFRYQLLLDSLKQALSAGASITDEASAIEWLGNRPVVVEGDCRNIKITQSADLELAQFYLQQALL